ncbi:MAG: PASTA domain-containing protein, partial [Eubacterium sp.]|nr:PASTA domain-containing protein [Eubacterium sp.]
VPNVIGITQERAEQSLSQKGLTNIKIAKVDSDTEAEGNVIYTEPRFNSYVSKDTLITVYVSTGPTTTTIENIKMPNVVGLSKSDAAAFLQKAGFKNVVYKTEDTAKPKDIVIAQSQSDGNYVKEDTKITLTVSSGVTTTESTSAAVNYKVNVNVLLPNMSGDSYDNVIIYVNGAQHSSSRVRLDGTIASFPVEAEAGSKLEVEVLLASFNATHKFNIDVDKNKDAMVDFSDYGVNNQG